jgi:hypothetical protein
MLLRISEVMSSPAAPDQGFFFSVMYARFLPTTLQFVFVVQLSFTLFEIQIRGVFRTMDGSNNGGNLLSTVLPDGFSP